MHRICIIGCGGSGKSTLAATLKEHLNIPLFHLDSLFWQPNWVAIDRFEWVKLQQEICSTQSWIMDGNYGASMDVRLRTADTIIFLNLPSYICLWRVVKRYFMYRGSNRPNMANGCREKLDLAFIWWILSYSYVKKPSILKKLKGLENKQIYIFNSSKDVKNFLTNLSH